MQLGAEVIYESMYDVHVSGHACQEEQKLMLTLAKPQFFLPVHGEYKHLKKHAHDGCCRWACRKRTFISVRTATAWYSHADGAYSWASRCPQVR